MLLPAWTRGFRPLPVLAALLVLAGCPAPRAPRLARVWVAGSTQPSFDPDGPPHALRWALERLLSRGLVELDSTGRVVPAAAESISVSADGRTWTFRLRPGLRYTDGTPVTSADFRDAMLAGLPREDHATRAWLLAALTGVERVRAGRPLPAIGIETPGPATLVLRLAAPDSLLLDKLALPGVATPWKRRAAPGWKDAVGIGPFRVVAAESGKSLLLARADSGSPAIALADTLRVRFVVGSPRLRALLRQDGVDMAWPLPPAFLAQAPPEGYRTALADAFPRRHLLLVLRADVPPTTKAAARYALAHAVNRQDIAEALGPRARMAGAWLPGAGEFDFPRLDAAESQAWLARGHLGASIHVVLAYDADLAGADVARALQGSWAKLGFYAELRALRGDEAVAEPLRAAAGQAQLVESQALVPGLQGELAGLVMPIRGPATGSFRTGWRTREFDSWLLPGRSGPPLDAAVAQSRLAQERNVLPLAELPWIWVERQGQRVIRLESRFGPEFGKLRPPRSPNDGSR
jgi:ABC-type transport system substrate-binding protein